MVNFYWGAVPKVLPKSNDFMENKIRNFIINDDRGFKRTFLFNYKKALKSVKDEEKEEFKEKLKEIYDKILSQPLQPILERDAEAWKGFSKIRTKTDSITNESNIEYIKNKTIADVEDNKTRRRLLGAGALSYGRNQEDLPSFDFDDWFSIQDIEIGDGVSYDLVIKEGETQDGLASGLFSYSFNKSLQILDAHFEFEFPPFDSEELMNGKVDWLQEKTGSTPKPKLTKQKIIVAKGVIPHRIVIPEAAMQDLKEGSATNWVLEQEYKTDKENEMVFDDEGEVTSRNQRIHIKTKDKISEEDYNKLNEKDKKNYQTLYLEREGTEAGYSPAAMLYTGGSEKGEVYSSSGNKIILTNDMKDSPFTNAEVIAAIGANPEMQDKSLVKLGDKIYSYHFSKGTKKTEITGGELFKRSENNRWKTTDADSPYSFIEKNNKLFMKMINRQLTSPTEVYTIRILGNIKTEMKEGKGLKGKLEEANYPTKKKPSTEEYTLLRHMVHKKTGQKLSFEEYSKLPETGKKEKDILWTAEPSVVDGQIKRIKPKDMPKNKKIGDVKEEGKYISGKNDYEAYSSKATLSEIEELSEGAFKNKETGDLLSETDYKTLTAEEKKKYIPEVRIIKPKEESIGWDDASGLGKDKYSSGTSTGYTLEQLEEALLGASVEYTIEATKTAEFNLNPTGRSGVNTQMKSVLDTIKSNLRDLNKKLKGV
tara:strand:- start:11284 stop:13404 length:2121 start_codon:yes stop_codon:yes gene_type:complete